MDTAQPVAAAETDAIANAAAAFKTYDWTNPEAGDDRARDEQGRFAADTVEEEETDATGDEPEAEDVEDEQEAAEEAQPLPPSWPEDQAEHWNALPAETQAFIAEREAERERAVQAKFQESANARKAAEAQQEEANANRSKYAEALDVLISAIQPAKPDARAYGAGTGQYAHEAYDLAVAEYEQQMATPSQLFEQKGQIQQQQAQESNEQFLNWKREHGAQYAPKFVADVKELTDAAKAEPTLRAIVQYAVENGIPESVFAPEAADQITSAQLHILWKAQQFDKLRSQKVEPKPKPASPAVKPGVSSPRSAQKAAARQRNFDQLARSGSIEAGAAVFKDIFRTR